MLSRSFTSLALTWRRMLTTSSYTLTPTVLPHQRSRLSFPSKNEYTALLQRTFSSSNMNSTNNNNTHNNMITTNTTTTNNATITMSSRSSRSSRSNRSSRSITSSEPESTMQLTHPGPNIHRPHIGFAFDIDGCLVLGPHVLEAGKRAIELVRRHRIPHIFLTNGGGVPEHVKAKQLNDWFDFGRESDDPESASNRAMTMITQDQVVLSHTPMKRLVEKHRNDLLLMIGGDGIVEAARGYGFNKPINVHQLFAKDASAWPFSTHSTPDLSTWEHVNGHVAKSTFSESDIAGVCIFTDGVDWGKEIQLVCDVLISGLERTGKQPPLYLSNPDFSFASDHHRPRMAQGALRLALEVIYKQYTGMDLVYEQFGKPTKHMYDYATDVLNDINVKLHGKYAGKLTHKYGIGDNPTSDIRGANNNDHWTSVLVRTGVAQNNCAEDRATLVFDHVQHAVQTIIRMHDVHHS
jgi:HAD superfamily hydrolase (TIGR01456 family)